MTKNELIELLQQFDGNPNVMILEGSNGQGIYREINLKPYRLHEITEKNVEDSGDCDWMEGEKVIVLGYGFY